MPTHIHILDRHGITHLVQPSAYRGISQLPDQPQHYVIRMADEWKIPCRGNMFEAAFAIEHHSADTPARVGASTSTGRPSP